MSYQSDRITGIPAPLPKDYDRQTNFTDYQTANPGKPIRGTDLDAEFNAIEQATDETQARLRLIQRDDGALANRSVGLDQLTQEAQIGVNAPTDWAEFTQYNASDSVIVDDGAWYICLESHVSSDDFQADLSAGKWRELINLTPYTTEAKNWATYPEDDPVPEGDGSQYSALHHATKALAAQVAANLSAQSASDDATQTAADRVQTGQDATQTAADRVQTGLDRTAASNAATTATNKLTEFQGQYYGALASDPTEDPNGNPPGAGDLYFSTTAPVGLRGYDADAGVWRELGNNYQGVYDRRDYTVGPGGEDTFAVTYEGSLVDVLVNGALLPRADYTATSGTDVVTGSLLPEGTEVTVIGLGKFDVADVTNALVTSASGTQTIGTALNDRVLHVPDITALRALPGVQDGQAARIAQTGRAGNFYFDSGDMSAEVAADPHDSETGVGGGVYVAPLSDPTGASGAWVRSISGYIAPEFFGVDGSASAADKSAWDAFFSYHVNSGIKARCLSKLYLFDPDSHGVVRAGVDDGQSVDFDGNGATFRFVSGMGSDAGKFWNMVIFASGGPYSPAGATVERIHVRNVVLDGNMRGQPTPAVPSDYEQRASMKVYMDASDGNRCKDVWFHNVTQIDPQADTLQFGPSTSGTVNGEASINNLTVSKFHAGARTGVRAAIQIGSQCGRINISDVTKDEPTGSERNSIETEFSVMGPQKVTMNMSNVHIDDVELGCPPGNEDRFIINMSNVVTDGFFACIGGSVYADNCKLRLSLSAAQRIKDFVCSNTRFIHAIRGDTGGPYSLSVVAISGGTHWQFSNVRHVCEGAVDPSAGEPLFNTGNIDASEIDDHVFEMSNVWYDPACPTGIDCYAGGTLRTRGCTMGGFDRGVLCGGFSSFGSNWYSDGDDFTQVTGDKFRIAGGANSSVVIGTQVTDSLEFATTGATQDIITSSGRSIQVSAAPSGGGAVGDRAVLGPSEYDSATSGDPVSWMCVRSNSSSAGWVATVTKP